MVFDDKFEAHGTDEKTRGLLNCEKQRGRANVFGSGGQVITSSQNGSDAEIVYADVEPQLIKVFKYNFDYAGDYQRLEVFAPLFKDNLDIR